MDLAGERARALLRPGGEEQPGDFVGEVGRAGEACKRSYDNKKREYRHQDRQRDMAGDGPAVIAVEAKEGFHDEVENQTDRIQCGAAFVEGLINQIRHSTAPAKP